VYLIAVRYEKLEKRELRNTRGIFDKILAASHRTDEMLFIITYPVFVLVKNAIKGHALWSSFYTWFGLASKHAWDTNCFSIVSEAATAYVFYPFKRFKLHYLFILRSYNMRWE
jgi:hypothetical protein